MMDRILANTKVLEKALDTVEKRNQVISHNISNVDTPGYHKKEVSFEKEFAAALDSFKGSNLQGRVTREGHIPIGDQSIDSIQPEIVETKSTKLRVDENNVDVETEMAALATNTIMYQALTQKMNGELQRLKSIINEGRR